MGDVAFEFMLEELAEKLGGKLVDGKLDAGPPDWYPNDGGGLVGPAEGVDGEPVG